VIENLRNRILTGCILWVSAASLVLVTALPGFAEKKASACSEVKNQWEQSVAELKEALRELKSLRKTPVGKIIDRPIVLRSSSKTIAQQVSEALQAKEIVLDRRREKCEKALGREKEGFQQLEVCLTEASTSKKGRKLSRLTNKRRRMIDNAVALLSKVREVEGRAFVPSYADVWGYGHPQYQLYQQPPGAPNRYLRQYQQMYRGWWGR